MGLPQIIVFIGILGEFALFLLQVFRPSYFIARETWKKVHLDIRVERFPMKAVAQIFLSYARDDREKVENLYQKLSNAGFKPWMDTKDILPGERWKSIIQNAVRRSDFFLVCLSKNSVDKRGWIQKEIKEALDIWQEMLDSDIYLIPVRLEDCEAPKSLSDFQWVNLFERDGWSRLVKAIRAGIERRAEAPTDKESPGEGPEQVYSKKIVFVRESGLQTLSQDSGSLTEHPEVRLQDDLEATSESATDFENAHAQSQRTEGLSEPTVLVVDDDLSSEDDLFRHIEDLFASRAKVQLLSDPKEACTILSQHGNILGCITDIVFRKYSQLAGVEVAETAIRNNVRVVAFTGHKRQNIGLALDELKRIGLPEERVLTKPVTFKQHREFFEQVKGWILGFDAL